MTYKVKQTWKDLIEKPHHVSLSRRDLLARGLATGFVSFALPEFLRGSLNQAQAANLTCPPTSRALGAIAQIYSQGGPTMGARFIGEDQAALMNATVAANYGITGTNLQKLGPNLVIDTTSPFGAVLLQGPPGFPGGAAAWQTNVLGKISGGGHRGPFNMDDGAGANTGLMGGASAFKSTQLGKDLRVGVSNKMANWAGGLPASSVSGNNLTQATLAGTFSVTPNAAGLVTAQTMTEASNAAIDLASALSPLFNNANRNGSTKLLNNAGCALYGNSALADPNFGSALFNPSNIAALTATLTVPTLTASEQAMLAAYYQSASGVIGGVITQLNGRDYHGQSPQNVIAPADIEEARSIVMFLAACHAAQSRGAFLYFSNGQAIASGVTVVTATVNGTALTLNAPTARGDAGGSYNAGLVLFYDPAGAPPSPLMTGTVTANNGNVKTSSKITSSAAAVSGLYLSALAWINNGSIPAAAISAMGVSNTADVVVI